LPASSPSWSGTTSASSTTSSTGYAAHASEHLSIEGASDPTQQCACMRLCLIPLPLAVGALCRPGRRMHDQSIKSAVKETSQYFAPLILWLWCACVQASAAGDGCQFGAACAHRAGAQVHLC
jgi:hypothetical protein